MESGSGGIKMWQDFVDLLLKSNRTNGFIQLHCLFSNYSHSILFTIRYILFNCGACYLLSSNLHIKNSLYLLLLRSKLKTACATVTSITNNTKENLSEQEAINRLRQGEEKKREFSWTKGIVLGAIGKIAGSAIVSSTWHSVFNKAREEILHATPSLQGAGADAIKAAVKKSATGLHGNFLRNRGWWTLGGGVVGGLGTFVAEQISHHQDKAKAEENINDLNMLEHSWVKRENERRARPAAKEI